MVQCSVRAAVHGLLCLSVRDLLFSNGGSSCCSGEAVQPNREQLKTIRNVSERPQIDWPVKLSYGDWMQKSIGILQLVMPSDNDHLFLRHATATNRKN